MDYDLKSAVRSVVEAVQWEKENPGPYEELPDLPFHRLRHEFHIKAMTEQGQTPMEYGEWRRFCRHYTAWLLLTDYNQYRISSYAVGVRAYLQMKKGID